MEVTNDTDIRPAWDKLQDKAEELTKQVARHFEDQNDVEGGNNPFVNLPTQPTAEEWERHQTTHTPYAAWCPHCNVARAVGRNHARIKQRAHITKDVDEDKVGPVKILMDYMYSHERNGPYQDERANPPHMVMIEHRFGRGWAHRVPNKGVHNEASWLPKKLLQDVDNIGLQNMRIIVKADQEPAIVDVQTAIQELRPNTSVPIKSPVGESESNGRAENFIRRTHEKIRTLRHHVESKAGVKLPDQSPVMAWLVRWSAELLSKYSRGDDGKSPCERIRGETSKVPLVSFGEKIFYLPMKIVKRQKGGAAKLPGIWLGVNERTEETLVGTERGIIKCRTVSRLNGEEAWDKELLLKMKGLLWRPVPGREDMRIPVEISVDEGAVGDDDDNHVQTEHDDDDRDDTIPTFRGGPHSFHVSRKAVMKYGTTEGCAACTALKRLGHLKGKLNHNHIDACST